MLKVNRLSGIYTKQVPFIFHSRYKSMDPTNLLSYHRLVHNLSKASPETCRAEPIDFVDVGLLEYKGLFATLIHDAFSKEECQSILEVAEASNNYKWDQALVNIGNGEQALYTDVRLCERIIWDDEDIAARVMDRVLPHLPQEILTLQDCARITGHGPVKRKETWRISRLNERLRFLKYTRGMYFRPHCDGSYATPDNKEITFLTVHLYLNGGDKPEKAFSAKAWRELDDSKKPLEGGATRFFSMSMKNAWDVSPKTGSIVVFQHRNLLHSGEDVSQGTKYTMRSDILYEKVADGWS